MNFKLSTCCLIVQGSFATPKLLGMGMMMAESHAGWMNRVNSAGKMEEIHGNHVT